MSGDEAAAALREARLRPWPGNVGPLPGGSPPLRSVGFTISTLGYEISRRFREMLGPLELEPREFALLRAVGAEEGRSQQAVGAGLRIAPSRMVAFVDGLEARGLLERRLDADDRRTRALHLTDLGRDLLGRAFAQAVEHERTLCGELDAAEREQLLDLLGRVGARLDIPPGVHSADGHCGLADE
jgi:DNA-binding MarR family transcriptional regulator